MSYILDALKKAESERRLGSIPDLHAQPALPAPPDGKPAVWRRLLMVTVLATLSIILVSFAWLRPWQAVSPAAVTAPSPVQPRPKAVQAEPTPAVAAPTPPPSMPEHPLPRRTTPHEKAAEPKNEPRLAKKSAPSRTVPAAVPSSQPRVATLQELPEHIQREIPRVTINGYIYSSVPSERSVLINKKLLHEGDEVGPGLVLEKMMPKEAVFNYNGYRYRLAY